MYLFGCVVCYWVVGVMVLVGVEGFVGVVGLVVLVGCWWWYVVV